MYIIRTIQAFKEQELPRDIANRIKLQEEKIQQQQAELEKLRKDTKEAQEVWQMKREKEQAELFQRQREELERLKEKLKEIEIKSSDNPAEQQQQQQVCVRVCEGEWVRFIFSAANNNTSL